MPHLFWLLAGKQVTERVLDVFDIRWGHTLMETVQDVELHTARVSATAFQEGPISLAVLIQDVERPARAIPAYVMIRITSVRDLQE